MARRDREGAYFKVSQKFEGTTEELTERILNTPKVNVSENMKELEKAIDEVIKHLATGKKSTVYGANMPKLPATFRHQLAEFPDTIACRPGRERSLGINVPTEYLSTAGSLTEVHHEDDALESVSGSFSGAPRIWAFIHTNSISLLNEVLAKVIQEKERKLSNVIKQAEGAKRRDLEEQLQFLNENFLEGCSDLIGHKLIVVTMKFLRDNAIVFQLVTQEAGDLIFIDIGIPHRLVNTEPSWCTAANVGSSL